MGRFCADGWLDGDGEMGLKVERLGSKNVDGFGEEDRIEKIWCGMQQN